MRPGTLSRRHVIHPSFGSRTSTLATVAGPPKGSGKSRLGRAEPLLCRCEPPWQALSLNQESHGFSRVECQEVRQRITSIVVREFDGPEHVLSLHISKKSAESPMSACPPP